MVMSQMEIGKGEIEEVAKEAKYKHKINLAKLTLENEGLLTKMEDYDETVRRYAMNRAELTQVNTSFFSNSQKAKLIYTAC